MSDAVYCIRRGTRRGEGEYLTNYELNKWTDHRALAARFDRTCDAEDICDHMDIERDQARIVRLRRRGKEWEALRTAARHVLHTGWVDHADGEYAKAGCSKDAMVKLRKALDSVAPPKPDTEGGRTFDESGAPTYPQCQECSGVARWCSEHARRDSRDHAELEALRAVALASRTVTGDCKLAEVVHGIVIGTPVEELAKAVRSIDAERGGK